VPRWECRAPSHNLRVFTVETEYQQHLIKKHGVPEVHAGNASSVARRFVIDNVLQCPFLDEFKPSEKVEASAAFLSKELQAHVANHMEEIAMLTLQKLPGDGDENAEEFRSDQASDGPRWGLGITRASMHSVLDNDDQAFWDEGSIWRDRLQNRVEDLTANHGIPFSDFVETEESFRGRFEGFARKMREPRYTALMVKLRYLHAIQWAKELDELEMQTSRYRFAPFIWTSLHVSVQVRSPAAMYPTVTL
jgi:hypothetical protein